MMTSGKEDVFIFSIANVNLKSTDLYLSEKANTSMPVGNVT